jgi:transaldolase
MNRQKKFKNLNKKTKSIISIFAGRMADKGKDPLPIFKKSISLTKKNKNIEILWASTREAYNYIQAKQLKCNIITMPPKVINQINSFGKSFKSMTIDTVKGFLKIVKNLELNFLTIIKKKTLNYIKQEILL